MREGKVVVPTSSMGLRREDEEFESGLKIAKRRAGARQKQVRGNYDLFASTQPHVDPF